MKHEKRLNLTAPILHLIRLLIPSMKMANGSCDPNSPSAIAPPKGS